MAGSSGIFKAKQKRGVTFNSNKLGSLILQNFQNWPSALCSAQEDRLRSRLVGHFAYCATPLSLMSFKLSKTFNYQPLFFHSPTQNENVKKVQSVFLPNWNWLFLLIFSLFKVEKIKIHDWSTAEVSSWISQLCSSN